MMPKKLAILVCLAALLLGGGFVAADEPAKNQPQAATDRLVSSEHEITIAGQAIRYKATTGTMAMKDEAGKHKADVFFVAYDRLPAPEKPADRPITFVFNGGPGAAAVWLHLGTAGPKRVKLTDNGGAPAPPHEVIDNEFSWLDATDLVFIDPVNTGFSRAAQGEDPKQFFGLEEDARWVAEFIRLYLTRNGRWASPKFLAGESYGTTRAAKLSEVLLESHGIALNGIVFISTVLNFQTISFGNGNDLPYPLFLPSYTAVAWYHKRLATDLQADLPKALEEAETFARGEYLSALALGEAIPKERRTAVAQKLARLTGLPADMAEKADLRIDPGLFRKAILADDRLIVGRFDGRITGVDAEPLDRDPQYDPSLSQYLAAYSGAFNDYIRRELKFETDLDYEVLSGRVHPWNFGGGGWAGYPGVARDLRSAMIKNPHLRVLVASGYYDLATPYLAAVYTVDQIDVGEKLRQNIKLTYYEGGHMMYHYRPALEQLHGDVKSFIEGATP